MAYEQEKLLKAKELIKERMAIDFELLESLNPLVAFGLVHAILSLEYKKSHPDTEWKNICNCSNRTYPHYHHVTTIFEDEDGEWKSFEKKK